MDIKTATALHRLRLVSVPEALSFPALLIFGSLLSRISDIDLVMPLGVLHAVLFLLYLLMLAVVWIRAKWSVKKVALFFVLAVLPFGGLYGDKILKRDERDGVIASRARKAGVTAA
ncbi:DUF3817 domain-containing protein [Streptomyces sp. H27-D2]|uniref:DUF3817 domain-containing protein n=1 Tax=Streptomyces sp. H27-D2 TaxID=3046304 RepID=UPI002DB64D99|nr:DUF3817 domain-containing protein [Streptomyces sp. H27-D2]MEC4018415.1 DUF3817 domain-containing protein [Streptomyces sp. H27-D2]